MGGSVKRSLAMVLIACPGTIAKAYGLDAATPLGLDPKLYVTNRL